MVNLPVQNIQNKFYNTVADHVCCGIMLEVVNTVIKEVNN